MYSITHVTYGY